MPAPVPTRFRAFPHLDPPEYEGFVGSRHRLGDVAARVFAGDRLQERFIRALCQRRVLNPKEVLESFELHFRARRRVRRPVVADLCCGHGLTGILFAMSERSVEQVLLVDQRRPASVDIVLEAAAEVAPWVTDKVGYIETDLQSAAEHLPDGAAVIGVHACGVLTDQCIDAVLSTGGPIAVMPCCYRNARREGPAGLRAALGTETAIDVDRTYRLTAAGYTVEWTEIPAAITPMNRVLIGRPPEPKR